MSSTNIELLFTLYNVGQIDKFALSNFYSFKIRPLSESIMLPKVFIPLFKK